MKDDAKQKLRNWMLGAVPLVRPDNPINVHFDELLGRGTHREDMIDACEELFLYAIEQFLDEHGNLVLILMIPLTNGDSLMTTPPTWAEIRTQHHSTPPSIYVVHRESLSRPERTERYQVPMSLNWVPANDDRYFVCYKVWRQPDADADDGWVREVFVEFNPPTSST